jgi:importin subunit beta-1
MADITAVLQAAQSPDAATRQQAEAQLQSLEAGNYPSFLMMLVGELAAEAKPALTRKLAGLIMKNAVFAQDPTRRAEKAGKWAAVDAVTKAQIRAGLLATLGSQARAGTAWRVASAASVPLCAARAAPPHPRAPSLLPPA